MSTILVGEDNAVNRELVRELLESFGHEVIEAGNGREVLERLYKVKTDLVLLDIQMPVLDGYAVLRVIRDDEKLKTMPVVALTAFAMRGDREKALDAGFDAHLSKPLDVQKLKSLTKRLLEENN